jgi:hypothetical protein
MHDLFHSALRAVEAAGFVTICDNRADDWPLPWPPIICSTSLLGSNVVILDDLSP